MVFNGILVFDYTDNATIPRDYVTGGVIYATATTNYGYSFFDDAKAERIKEANRRWRLFRCGNGWTDGCPLVGQRGFRRASAVRFIPTLRQARRVRRPYRLFTLKQLRRMGLIA